MKCACESCKRNCCGHNFVGLANSFKSHDKDLFNQILLTEEEEYRIKKKYGDKFIEYIDGLPYMSLNKDRSCKAFCNNKCLIYDERPDVCKLYPYYFDPFGGVFIDKNCPNFEDDGSFDKEKIFELLSNRIKLFSKLEGKKHKVIRQRRKLELLQTKEDVKNLVDKMDYLSIKDNQLYIKGKGLMQMINKYGHPLSVGFVDLIGEKIERMKKLFENKIRQYNFDGEYYYAYATKANYFAEVVSTAKKDVDYLEMSSARDVELIIQLCKLHKMKKGDKIICNGFKSKEYVDNVVKLDKFGLNIVFVLNNEKEYDLIKNLQLKNVELGIRYDCQEESRLMRNNYDNFDLDDNRFGCNEKTISKLTKKIEGDGIFKLSLFHFHLGGQIKDAKKFELAFENICNVFAKLKKHNKALKFLDFGGGFPQELPFNEGLIEDIVSAIVRVSANICKKNRIKFNLIGEHGRFTTAEHGLYLFKIENQIENNGKKWFLVEAALMNYIPDLWALQENFVVLPVNYWDKEFAPVYLGGLTCDEDDRFFVDNKNMSIMLPDIKNGEQLFVAVLGIGSYQEMLSGDSSFSHCMISKGNELVIKKDKEFFIKSKPKKRQTLKRLSYTRRYLRNFK